VRTGEVAGGSLGVFKKYLGRVGNTEFLLGSGSGAVDARCGFGGIATHKTILVE